MTLEATGLSERLTKLTLSGRLDTPGVDAIETAFVAALVPGSKSAIVDLSRLEFVASMGLRMFISVARSLRMRHAKLVLYSVPPLIGEVFENASLFRDHSDRDRRGRGSCRGLFVTSSSLSPDAGGSVLTFRGTQRVFEEAFRSFRRLLDNYALSKRARNRCELGFEEIVTNVVNHGYRDARPRYRGGRSIPPHSIVMRFEDDGVSFDAKCTPGSIAAVVERDVAIGGRGLQLCAFRRARNSDYTRTATGRNRLTVTIRTTTATGPAGLTP